MGSSPSPERQQEQVTELFRSSTSEWEQIYTLDDVYSVIYQRRRNVALSLVKKLGLTKDSRVLEVGCGPGVTTAFLKEAGYQVHALDIVPEMVAKALQRAQTVAGGTVDGSVGDACSLAFRDGVFDLVLVVGVTEWVARLPVLLKELARVVKPSKFLIISSDNSRSLHLLVNPLRYSVFAGLRRAFASMMSRERSHPKPQPVMLTYSEGEFRAHLARSGLVPIETQHVGFGPFPLLGRSFVPVWFGIKVDRQLQTWADVGFRLLKTAGHVYIVVAKKPPL